MNGFSKFLAILVFNEFVAGDGHHLCMHLGEGVLCHELGCKLGCMARMD